MIYLIFTVAMILSFALGFHEGVKSGIRKAAKWAAHMTIVSIVESMGDKK